MSREELSYPCCKAEISRKVDNNFRIFLEAP